MKAKYWCLNLKLRCIMNCNEKKTIIYILYFHSKMTDDENERLAIAARDRIKFDISVYLRGKNRQDKIRGLLKLLELEIEKNVTKTVKDNVKLYLHLLNLIVEADLDFRYGMFARVKESRFIDNSVKKMKFPEKLNLLKRQMLEGTMPNDWFDDKAIWLYSMYVNKLKL